MSWFVYMIETVDGLLYTGITTDLQRRFMEHSSGATGAKFFRIHAPLRVVFQEPHADRSAASKREAVIKRMSKKQKLMLITESASIT